MVAGYDCVERSDGGAVVPTYAILCHMYRAFLLPLSWDVPAGLQGFNAVRPPC
jgi:hypothetical protein